MSPGYQGGYIYAPPPPPHQYHPHPHDNRGHYDHGHGGPQYAPPPPFPSFDGGYMPYPLTSGPMQTSHPAQRMPPPPPGIGIQVVHTDDAATKLSDRVCRRCFNCCTTDTSTWRRSNLSQSKAVCLVSFFRRRARPRSSSNRLRLPPRRPYHYSSRHRYDRLPTFHAALDTSSLSPFFPSLANYLLCSLSLSLLSPSTSSRPYFTGLFLPRVVLVLVDLYLSFHLFFSFIRILLQIDLHPCLIILYSYHHRPSRYGYGYS
ncbi:hypothetical protein K438DRAFT_1810260 [Mycena galopus ATCC 62051]|nr:hypothetical protein K438DRAFT_1810260 [Mycena galopus ATCC 62051]